MKKLDLVNPFGAPVYHMDTVSSTMDVSRKLAADGAAHGTVITVDYQEAGRGRGSDLGKNRTWEIQSGLNLPFTILLRFSCIEHITTAFTLRAGLAVSLAIEDFMPSLQGLVFVKWTNDVIINNKKVSGILCEAESGNVHLGIGINVSQKEFPDPLCKKATSLALAAQEEIDPKKRFDLLKKTLARLYEELETEAGNSWKQRLEQRLYKKGEQILFAEGSVGCTKEIKGTLSGIGDGGELIILPKGENNALSLISGEIILS